MEQQSAQSRALIHLPEEIVIDILLHMPVKSLVRFRCVCKRWRSLLSGDRDFSAGYLCRKPRRHCYLHMSERFPLKLPPLLSLIPDQLPDLTVHIEPPPLQRHEEELLDLEVIGCIDGVFCLYYKVVESSGRRLGFVKSIVLWNPTTRDFHHTPSPEIFLCPDSQPCSFGFGFGFARGHDGSSFKVVVIVGSHCPEPEFGLDVKEVEVYDSRSDAWTKMDNPPKTFHSFDSLPYAIVNGVPYWRLADWSGSIISFDPATNKFRQFKGPEFGVDVANYKIWTFGEIDESLVAIDAPGKDEGVNVWKLVDDHRSDGEVIWIKQFSFGPADGVEAWIQCWKNREFLVRTKFGYCLWDGWSKQICRVFPTLRGPRWWISDVFLFPESLVPPRHHVLPHLNSANPGENRNEVEGESNGNEVLFKNKEKDSNADEVVEGKSNGNEGEGESEMTSIPYQHHLADSFT